MSVKKTYGIYLAYPPTIDLRDQGLGRHLAAFLKGAIESRNAEFIIVCPSWSKEGLRLLMEAELVPQDSFQIMAPPGQVISLIIYDLLLKVRGWLKRSKKPRIKKTKKLNFAKAYQYFKARLLLSTNIFQVLLFLPPLIISGLLIVIKYGFTALRKYLAHKYSEHQIEQKIRENLKFFLRSLASLIKNPKDNTLLLGFYKRLEARETTMMLAIIAKMRDVRAWYAPTAFWPSFNKIQAPRLMCVPDVVLTEFPVGFSQVGGDRFLDTFNTVEEAIHGGSHFVTYSEHIKQSILIHKYRKTSNQVYVVPHAANVMDVYLQMAGSNIINDVSECQKILLQALKKSANPEYTGDFQNASVKYIFYASQFRPSKNVLSLLRAYHYLLRYRFISHKLILTGRKKVLDDVDAYIAENNLEKDVLLLSGLSVKELAVCYKLADLAVNPSLSEGGCPFTFTEALSVRTPVLMANIPVTTEVLTNESLQQMTLFDPYNWHDLAKKTEWALDNKDLLLERQLVHYEKLATRSWQDVVFEYIDILEKIAQGKEEKSPGFFYEKSEEGCLV